jgi:zinc protease
VINRAALSISARLTGFAVAGGLLLAAALALSARAAVPANTPAAAHAGASGSVPAGVLRATLENGLRVVIVPDRLAPIVTTEINYLAGSNDAPDGFPGTAHALEHMMFRGSAGLDRDQLSELGALLGGDYNADTTETVTQYFYTVPAANLPVALHVEALRMNGLDLNQADWDKERGAIEQEVSHDLSSPIYTYLEELQAIMFAGTPYAHDALGTRPSFDKTDAKLLRAFYEKWYAPNNAILVIAGDVQPEQALAQVKAAFGAIPRRAVPPHAAFQMRPVVAKTLTLPTDFPVGLVALAYRMPGLSAKDFATADILSDVLGSERGALYALVPEGRALLAQFAFEPKADAGYGLAAAAFPKGGDPKPLLADITAIMANIAKHGVPADLVAAARRQEIAQLAFQADSITGLAESWSRALAFQGAESPDDIAKAYQAVTVDDVNRMAASLLDPNHAVTAILTPESSGKPMMGKGFGGAESFGGAPAKPVALPKWASDALASLHLPDPGVPPVVSVLPNGLRLIVQTEHVSRTVSVFGQVRQVAEMEEAPGHEGVAGIVGKLFDYGTEKHDRLGFQKALDDIAAQEEAGSRFTLKVLTADFEPGMQLLAENELHPAFPPQAFAIVRRQTAQSLDGMLQSPDYLFKRAILKSVVPPGDPQLRQATPPSVLSLKADDLTAYYKKAYRPDLTTIVIVGDTSPQEARRVVDATFGAWRSDGPTPAIDLPPIGANQASAAHVPDSSNLQDTVALAESVQLPVTNPDRYNLMVGNTILGGGFSSRLYQDLRVKTGYVYSVDSELDWSRTRCDYSVSFGADPDKVVRARALVIQDLQELQKTPVSDVELTRAKAQMLRRLPMQRASVDAIAALDLRLIDLGLPLDTPELAAKHYFEATPAQVQAAFKAWLRPSDLAEVVKGPAVSQ